MVWRDWPVDPAAECGGRSAPAALAGGGAADGLDAGRLAAGGNRGEAHGAGESVLLPGARLPRGVRSVGENAGSPVAGADRGALPDRWLRERHRCADGLLAPVDAGPRSWPDALRVRFPAGEPRRLGPAAGAIADRRQPAGDGDHVLAGATGGAEGREGGSLAASLDPRH